MQSQRVTYPTLHNQAVAHYRAGRHSEACEGFLKAIGEAGEAHVDLRTLKALWEAAQAIGAWKTAIAAGLRAASRDPMDFRFADRMVKSLRTCPLEALVHDPTAQMLSLPLRPPSLSVVVVSQDDERYARVDAEYARAFAHWPHQRIRVKGATSMYDGYARGFGQCTGDVVVFSHDDIRFAVPDFAARLADVMAGADLAGVAGTTSVTGPALLWSGHPHLFGAVTHKASADQRFEWAVSSLRGARIDAAQGLDGVFIAARREWVKRIGFDPEHITGFHYYDLDFSYRAYRLGARITIACDLALIHQSRGMFGPAFDAGRAEFTRKFPDLRQPAGEYRHWYALSLPDENAVAEQYAKLFAAWALPLT
jgi:hypothetical protein